MHTKSKSSITTDAEIAVGDWIPLLTPGEYLREEFLEPMGISAYALAKAIGVHQSVISKLYAGMRVSPELGLKLDRYFRLHDGWWLGLQADYETRMAKRKVEGLLATIRPHEKAA
jgi:addiction module HigA family antidote